MQLTARIRSISARPVFRRVAAGFAANLLGKFWVTALQFAAIPILTQTWGVNGFGIWLMVSTVPTYIALSASGFSTVAATDMTRQVSQNNTASAIKTFQSAWIIITGLTLIACTIVLTLSVAACAWKLVQLASDRASVVAANLMALYTAAALQTALIQATYRATRRYATGTIVADLISTTESVAVLLVALSGRGIVTAATCMLVLRCIGTWAMYRWIVAQEPWFQIGIKHADTSTIRGLTQPAFATLGLTAAQSLSLQGVIVVLGLVTSPAIAAGYATARTLCRTPLQLSDIVNRATLPELTAARASGDNTISSRLNKTNLATTAVILIPAMSLAAVFGPWLMHIVSSRNIAVEPLLFPLLSIGTLGQGLWLATSQPLIATNKHHVLGYLNLTLSALVVLSPLAFYQTNTPQTAVAAVAATSELITCLFLFTSINRRDASLRRLGTN